MGRLGLNKGYFKCSWKKDKLADGVSRISEMHILKLKYVLNLKFIRFSHRVQYNGRENNTKQIHTSTKKTNTKQIHTLTKKTIMACISHRA